MLALSKAAPADRSKSSQGTNQVILLADDDLDDQLFVRRAVRQSDASIILKIVEDGEDLLDYLHRRGAYADPEGAPRPAIIFLDLNMPRKNGLEALREIRAEPSLRRIPIIILTTSQAEKDVSDSYDLGANAFITKPVSQEKMIRAMHAVGAFWFRVATTPKQ